MQVSAEYGTELLIRYTEEGLQRDLERRRVAAERATERRIAPGRSGTTVRARIATLFGAHTERVAQRPTGVSQVHAAHR